MIVEENKTNTVIHGDLGESWAGGVMPPAAAAAVVAGPANQEAGVNS